MKIGNRYMIKDNDDIMDEYRGKLFTVIRINDDYYYVLLDDDEDNVHHIDKNDWSGLVENHNSWHGNILLHRFI